MRRILRRPRRLKRQADGRFYFDHGPKVNSLDGTGGGRQQMPAPLCLAEPAFPFPLIKQVTHGL
jgi:hypothetical protein